MTSRDTFSEDYFERGVEKGISLYTNYHWMPERSFKEAHWVSKYLEMDYNDSIIDFGCAKGFLVRALRAIGFDAHGYDISDYAISKCHEEVRSYLHTVLPTGFMFGFCKDVLEHCIDIETLHSVLDDMHKCASKWLMVVPTGNGIKYNIPEYELDKTHHLRLTYDEWHAMFTKHFRLISSTKILPGIKDNWSCYPDGNLFVILER